MKLDYIEIDNNNYKKYLVKEILISELEIEGNAIIDVEFYLFDLSEEEFPEWHFW